MAKPKVFRGGMYRVDFDTGGYDDGSGGVSLAEIVGIRPRVSEQLVARNDFGKVQGGEESTSEVGITYLGDRRIASGKRGRQQAVTLILLQTVRHSGPTEETARSLPTDAASINAEVGRLAGVATIGFDAPVGSQGRAHVEELPYLANGLLELLDGGYGGVSSIELYQAPVDSRA